VIKTLCPLSFSQAEKLGAFLLSEPEMLTGGPFDVFFLFNAEHIVCMRELEHEGARSELHRRVGERTWHIC
jgi:hypothetical protein